MVATPGGILANMIDWFVPLVAETSQSYCYGRMVKRYADATHVNLEEGIVMMKCDAFKFKPY